MSQCDAQCTHGDDIQRDGRDRPRVEGRAYTRTSTFARTLDDKGGLIDWKARQTLIGSGAINGARIVDATAEGTGALNTLVEEALDASGANKARQAGTELHLVLERWAEGLPLGKIDTDTEASVRAVEEFFDLHGLVPFQTEQFVVNTAYGTAGTYDLGVIEEATGRQLLADYKTGAKANEYARPMTTAMQIAAYAGGVRYCPSEGWLPTPDWDAGLLLAVPVGQGACMGLELDLEAGAEALDLAAAVRKARTAEYGSPYGQREGR